MYLRVIYIFCLLSEFSCIAQKAPLKSKHIKYKYEILEYIETTNLNDTLIKEKKFLWNKNGRMSWFESTDDKKLSYDRFNFNFILQRDTVFLEYSTPKSHNNYFPFFSIKIRDTLESLNFYELQNNNIQYKGVVNFYGSSKIRLLGEEMECYVFKINEGLVKSNTKKEKIKEYYLSKKQLIPVMIQTKLIILTTGKVESLEELILVKSSKDPSR